MLDIPVYMGVNAPKEHQRAIARLTHGMYDLYLKGLIKYEPLPEAMINESESSPTPDVLLFDGVLRKNMVIIEVTSTTGAKKDFRKTIELVDDYDVAEGFIYDYQQQSWRKYKLHEGEITENPSFCDSIGYDLNEFLK